jgi:hypothetical protein
MELPERRSSPEISNVTQPGESMQLPFTHDQFLDVFAAYNRLAAAAGAKIRGRVRSANAALRRQ